MSVAARLGAYYFAYFTYAGALMPYFSLWLAAQSFSAGDIALILAMPSLARIFAPAAWGWIADRSGWRRGIVVFSAFAVCLGFATLYAVRGLGATVLVMFLLSVLAAGALPIVESIALAATAGRAGQYGPIRLWGSVGFILAVLGTGAWLDHASPDTVLDIVVGLAAIVCAVALAIPAGRGARPARTGERIGGLLLRADVAAFFGACICMTIAHGAFNAFYSLYLEAAGYSKSAIGALWTLGVLAEIVLFLQLPALMRRFSLRALLLASFACAAVRFAAVALAVEQTVLMTLAQLLHAVTFGAFHAASIAAVHRLFAGPFEARGQSIYASLTYGVGGVAGTLIAGWCWSVWGPAASFAVGAAFGALGGLLIGWKVRL
jgi:PPP family 3-phenylpropionic acid transporter